MAGSIRGSDLAEHAASLERPASPLRARRWNVVRRAARARLAPFGAAVMLVAGLVGLTGPLLAPYDPLAQNLGNTLAPPGPAHPPRTPHVGRGVLSRGGWGTARSPLGGPRGGAVGVVTRR